jgi:xanthine dehydrogenase accessory factor
MEATSRIIEAARAWRPARMALATVLTTWGSAPSPRGSHMLVHEDGRFEGSVSGGCVEADIMATAEAVIASGRSARKTYGVADGDAWEVGLPCGGEIAVLVQPVSETGFSPALFDAIAVAMAEGETLSITTDTATGRSHAGESPVQNGNQSGALFVNRYRPRRRLIIVGAVQIAQALVGLSRELGMATTVIDPRGRFLTRERFPSATLDDRWPDEAVAALRLDAATALVTLSHDVKIDDPALIAGLAAPTGYIAALGSRRSQAARRDRLAVLGIQPHDIDRIEGPAGLPIGALGPAEIALSIAAGMVQALNRADLEGLTARHAA